jgi:hypothetical protein
MAIRGLAVFIVLAVLAVTLAMLVVPSLSWAAASEWLWTQLTAPGPCACMRPGN